MMQMKIFCQLMRWKPQMELPKTPRAFTVLQTWVAMIWMCVDQLSLGVKKMPKYLRWVFGVIDMC